MSVTIAELGQEYY